MDSPSHFPEGWSVTSSRLDRSVLTAVASFLLAGAIGVAVIAAATVLLYRHSAEREAIRDARVLTMVEARDVVGPALSDAALVPGSAAWQHLDTVVRSHVVDDQDVIRLKIWAADGTVVYSDDAAAIGKRFPLDAETLHAMQTDRTFADVSNLHAPENTDERRYGKLLEVYLGVHTESGRPLLFETYQRYDAITAATHRIFTGSVPALLAGLLLLYVVQAPLAYRLATRLRRAQRDREVALLDVLAASDRERRRIAADLHDGVVQGLAGVSYTLSAAAERAAANDDPQTASVVRRAAKDLRSWMRELRTLVVTIAPPKLHQAGLSAALQDLRGTLAGRGIDVTTDIEDLPDLDPEVETLAFRVAQEAVRNVVKHAHAHNVGVSAGIDGDLLTVAVVDDGRGVQASAGKSSEGGHGLDLLTDLARAQGGELSVGTAPSGVGTAVRLAVPTQRKVSV